MRISVVVPVWNEAAGLPALLLALQPLADTGAELIFVDGASHDGSAAVIERAGFQVIRSPTGRAKQMNAGAAVAKGDVLLFLHADTQLPAGALGHIQRSLHGAVCWGRFDVRIAGQAPMLKVVATLMNWRSRASGIATGDQALFMTAQAFKAVGGFPDQPLMEDIEICKRLRQLSRPACIAARVTTSGRRWETRGVWATIFLMWRLRWAYWRGRSASQLALLYR